MAMFYLNVRQKAKLTWILKMIGFQMLPNVSNVSNHNQGHVAGLHSRALCL